MTHNQTVSSVESILSQLVYGVIGSPDDLMGIGECLNFLDQLENAQVSPSERWTRRIKRLKQLFNRLVLEESPDTKKDWRDIQRLIQSLFDNQTEKVSSEAASVKKLEEEDLEWELALAAESDIPEETPPSVESGRGEASKSTEWNWDTFPSVQKTSESAELCDPELLKDFIGEAREHLASIELHILALESNPNDREAINAVFRPFHSIKGVAGFLNFTDIHRLSHEVENLLDAARVGELSISDVVIDLVLSAVDILKILLDNLERSPDRKTLSPEASSKLIETFLEQIRDFHGGEPVSPGTPLKQIGKILVEHGVLETEAVEEAAEQSRAKGKKLGEELISEGAATPREVSRALREQRHSKESMAFVRVDTQKLDNLVDTIGELVIAQSMVLQNPEITAIKDQKLQKDTVQLRRITAELQRVSMSMRMIPIKSTFQKMIRLVRDLSKKSGKEVVLQMKGEETEIDRNMVEEIYDPLVHLIRNAIDHGVETPRERELAGKDIQGTITLSAEQRGGNIIIDVQDDGRGLNAERIREKAIKRGILSPNDPIDENTLCELIFHAGFSTTEQVTDVSGRGVGMDVVKKSVEKLRGKVEVSSVPGEGTYFRLKLPLTMAIIDGMVICVGEERYVVPTIAMRESLRPTKESHLTVQKKGELVKIRNTLMPLIRLHQIFGVEPRHYNPWEGLLLVVSEDNRSYCLLADEIIGRQEVVIKSLGASMRHLRGISGGAILGDGKVVLILDVKGIVSLFEEGRV